MRYHYKTKVIFFTKDINKNDSTVAGEGNQSFAEMLSCFDNRTLSLRYIMNWPVTNRTYSTCSEDGKVNEANRKSFFRNKLQSLRPVAPVKSPPTCMTTSVVDAMRVVRIITIKNTNPPLFLTWARKAFAYTENFPGSSIDILFHDYN